MSASRQEIFMKRLLLGLVASGGLALSAGTLRDYVAAFNAEDE